MDLTTNIRFSPKILARLGEELNQSPSQGIVELVKNAYDADAPDCTVELSEVSKPGGSIRISDRGCGMDVGTIQNYWLVLGSSPKTEVEVTPLGRRVAGSKGLGRLSALRLGTVASLTSVEHTDLNSKYSITIDWGELDKANAVEDVDLKIHTTRQVEPMNSGSQICIRNLRDALNKNEVRRLARSLLLLSDPFDNTSAFKAKLISDEYQELSQLVRNSYFSACEFHMCAVVSEDGRASAITKDWRGDPLYTAAHDDLGKKKVNQPYLCPPTTFEIWIFLRSSSSYSTRNVSASEVNRWLDEFGGVHIYKNELRVSPYGDKGNDWLGINLLRAINPELRPSTNTCIGRIVVLDANNRLKQKTDRSGFIENESFFEIQRFAIDSLEWLAKRRIEERDKKRRTDRKESEDKTTKEKKVISDAIESIEGDSKILVKAAFEKHEIQQARLIRNLKKEVQLYRTLSTAGITTAVFAHESTNNPIKLIAQSIRTISHRAKNLFSAAYDDNFAKPVERILSSLETLRVLGNVTLSLISFDKRRATRVDIHEILKDIKELYDPFLLDRKTDMVLDFCPGKPYLRGSVAAFESIVTNLINNSLVSFDRVSPKDRKIVVSTKLVGDTLELFVKDNGSGITDIRLEDIWLPGETTRTNGTGLGMTIVKDAVEDLSGEVEAVAKGELGGAEIHITLPIIGA